MSFIETLKNLKPHCAGVIVFNLNNKHKCSIVQKNNDRIKTNSGFPKGKREGVENAFDCAKRELFEESGLSFNQLQFIDDFYITELSAKNNISVIYLVAKYIDKKNHKFTFDTDELKLSDFLLIDDAMKMLSNKRKSILQTAYNKILTTETFVEL